MIQKVSIPVSVISIFNHKRRSIYPIKIIWKNTSYPVERVGLHHKYREGRTLYHVFSVETPTLALRLVLNTDNLFWTLEEISDGLSN